ncbi:MAG: PFL family protein [Desulfonauticus sp.]|nr:PFL family protein [Desulfonauticus sp.]
MFSEKEILATFEMIKNEHLDVRTITLGISIFDCASTHLEEFKQKLEQKIIGYADKLVSICDEVGDKYGIEVVNKRIAISPIGVVAASYSRNQMVEIAKTLDDIAERVGIDFIGGFSALIEKGMTKGDRALIEAIPEALSSTSRVCASVNAASSKAGININGVYKLAKIIKQAAALSAAEDGIACAKMCVFANIPQDVPFMAGAYLGVGEPEAVINVGVSGPGVVKRAIERALVTKPDADLGFMAEVIKRTAFKVTRVGELIGREVAERLGVKFGIVDLSLAPTPNVGDSVGEIFQALGLESIGVPGSTALLAMLNDAVKKGGSFASSYVGGLSGAFIPVSEDLNINQAVTSRCLSLAKLEAMTSVCSVGLDMVAIPGDTSEETLAAIIADELAIGVINNKTTATRIIPVPGKKSGEKAFFGGLLGEATIIEVPQGSSKDFITKGGLIPAPIHSLKN